MKLIFTGTEAEKQWFMDALGCPHGVPCPHRKGEHPLGEDYPCSDCYAYRGASVNVTYVDELPDTTSADRANVIAQLKKHVERFKNCAGCTFMVNGKCFFDYNCPADFKAVKGGSICDDMSVSESN